MSPPPGRPFPPLPRRHSALSTHETRPSAMVSLTTTHDQAASTALLTVSLELPFLRQVVQDVSPSRAFTRVWSGQFCCKIV